MSSSSIPFMPTPVVIVTTIGATLSVGGAYVTIAFVVFVLRAFFPPDRDGPCSGKEVLQIIENTIKSRSTILWKAYNYLFPRLATQPEGTTMNHPAATAVEDLSVFGGSHIRGAKEGAAAAKPEDKSEIRNKHFFTRKISCKTKNWAALSCIAIFLLLSITLDFRGCSMTSYSIEEKGDPTFLRFFLCKTVGSPEVVVTGPIKEPSSKVTPFLADANVGIIMNVLEEKRTLNEQGIVMAEPVVNVVEPKTKGTSTYILSSTIEPGTEELVGVHDVIPTPPEGVKSELATVEEGRGVIREVDGEMVKQNLIGSTARLLKQHKRNLEEGKDNNVFSPTSEEAEYYYIDWTERKCVNDPAKRPSYIVEVGTDLFETAQECCQKSWLSQIPNNCAGSHLLFSNEQSVLTQSSNASSLSETATTATTSTPVNVSSATTPPTSMSTVSTQAVVTQLSNVPTSSTTESQTKSTDSYSTSAAGIAMSTSSLTATTATTSTPVNVSSAVVPIDSATNSLVISSSLIGSTQNSVPTVAPAHTALPTHPPGEPSDCICDFVNSTTQPGYIQKPNTNCMEYVACVDGHIDEEYYCDTVGMIFDSKKQSCNWLSQPFLATCQIDNPLDGNEDCWCEFEKRDCEKSLQCLSWNTISTWEKPSECTRADSVCLAGETLAGKTLYEEHYRKVCSDTIIPACEGGDRQSCFDKVTHCCGFDNVCKCDEIEDACDKENGPSCSIFADKCCKGESECMCDNKKKSCLLSLRSSPDSNEISQDCFLAEEHCCKDCSPIDITEEQNIESCQCSCQFWEDLCETFPGPQCKFFAGRCCGSPTNDSHNDQCYCDALEDFTTRLNYAKLNNEDSCRKAVEAELFSTSAGDDDHLHLVYNELGGQNWFDNTGWETNGSDYCRSNPKPFGLTCSNGLISDIDLSSNNLVGVMDSSRFFSKMYKLKSLKLANNTLKGSIDFNSFYPLRNLEHVDISYNFLEGEVDVLLSPAIKHVNMGHNNFSKVMSFTKFRRSHQTLEVLDFCFNNIHQDISKLLQSVPSNLKELVLTGNHISGSLPDPLPTLDNMERFILNNNAMIGTIPEIVRSFSRLKQLDLSNQKQSSNIGLSGSIPTSWANLPDLDTLNLSNNRLNGIIPPGIGNLPQLKNLNLSFNELMGVIPADIGNAAGICDVIDMSYNQLTGTIPSELEMFKDSSKNTHIYLGGNEHIEYPAPLDLCNVSGFDLHNDSKWCPPERNILKELYVSTKGGEWTESTNWIDSHKPHCDWYKVECSDGAVTELNLQNNGLSGKLTARISELHSLKVLDLRDNDIKDIIPATIGDLENLTHLRLSFNSFHGTVPSNFSKLHHLVEVHLHGNRLQDDMPSLSFHRSETHTLIADCGYPTDFDQPISCPNCTMCCNSDGDCHVAEITGLLAVDYWGFDTYQQFLWIFFFLLIGYTFTMVSASILYDWYRDNLKDVIGYGSSQPGNREVQAADQIDKSDEEDQAGEQDQADEKGESAHAGFSIGSSTLNSQQGGVADQAGPAMQTAQAGSITRSSVLNSEQCGGAHPASQTIHTGSVTCSSASEEDWKYALESFGRDSVYSYILSKSKFAWLISVAVVAFQTWALITFVKAAPKDFADEKSDWVYSWKCPRNDLECTDETDLTEEGWIIFAIIMFAHVLKDLINGLKLLLFCGKHKHDVLSRIKYYLGGFILSWVSALAVYASAVYNVAIARSNTDIVMNAVIIIFIVDVDEYLHKGIQAVQSLMGRQGFIEDENDAKITKLSATIETLSGKLEKNDEEIKKILRLNTQLMSRVDLLEKNGKGRGESVTV